MTRVIFVDADNEIIIHSLLIDGKDSKKRADMLFKDICRERGHTIERILVRKGMASVMEMTDEIPIPADLIQR